MVVPGGGFQSRQRDCQKSLRRTSCLSVVSHQRLLQQFDRDVTNKNEKFTNIINLCTDSAAIPLLRQ